MATFRNRAYKNISQVSLQRWQVTAYMSLQETLRDLLAEANVTSGSSKKPKNAIPKLVHVQLKPRNTGAEMMSSTGLA